MPTLFEKNTKSSQFVTEPVPCQGSLPYECQDCALQTEASKFTVINN